MRVFLEGSSIVSEVHEAENVLETGWTVVGITREKTPQGNDLRVGKV